MTNLELLMLVIEILGKSLLAIQITFRVYSFFKKKLDSKDDEKSDSNDNTK